MVGRWTMVAALLVAACGKGSAPPVEAEHAPAREHATTAATSLTVSSPTTRALPPLPHRVDWSGHFEGYWVGAASPTTGHTYGHFCDISVEPGGGSGELTCNGWQIGVQVTFRTEEREGRLDLVAVTSSGGPPIEPGRWFASITNQSGRFFYTWRWGDEPDEARPLRRLAATAK